MQTSYKRKQRRVYNRNSWERKESHKVTLLGCHIDRELKLNDHVSNKYKTAEKKVNALIRLCNILLFHRKRLLMKAFIESQFAYCPLVGLFHSRALNTKINLLRYRALQMSSIKMNYLLPKNSSSRIILFLCITETYNAP